MNHNTVTPHTSPSPTHQPASPVSTSHLCTLPLALYTFPSTFCFSSNFSLYILTSWRPEPTVEHAADPAARACMELFPGSSDPGKCPRHSPKHPDLVQLCCCTWHHHCYASQIITGLSCPISWKE